MKKQIEEITYNNMELSKSNGYLGCLALFFGFILILLVLVWFGFRMA